MIRELGEKQASGPPGGAYLGERAMGFSSGREDTTGTVSAEAFDVGLGITGYLGICLPDEGGSRQAEAAGAKVQ